MLLKFKANSLMVKMIIVYTIPFMLLSFILIGNHSKSAQNIRENFIANMTNAYDQSLREVERRLDMAYDLTEMVSRNNKIIKFIDDPYLADKSEFLYQYLDSVVPIIKYATAFTETDDYSIRIYMTKDEIPESWPYFLHLRDPEQDSAIHAFLEREDETQMWLAPGDPQLPPRPLHSERDKYTLLTKLYSPSRQLLGLVAVMVAEDSLLSTVSDDASPEFTQFLYKDGQVSLLPPGTDGEAEARLLSGRLNGGEEPHFIEGEHLYLVKTIGPIGQTLVHKVSLEQLNRSMDKSALNLVLLIVLSVLLLTVTCYVMFRTIFLRLNKIVSIMRKVINGNTYMRIPDAKPDELGQLARDFNGLIEMNNGLIERVVMKERLRKEAQIQALQYQINPHFIYNTLDIFRMQLIRERLFDMADRLADFGKILRYNLGGSTMHTTLREEIGLIRKYIGLQSLGSGREIRLEVDIPEELGEYPVIKFLLQPIVENSIKYGKGTDKESLRLLIRSSLDNGRVIVEVEDNGAGMSAAKADELNAQFRAPLQYEETPKETASSLPQPSAQPSIGLHNINSRLRLYYGAEYSLTIESKEGQFTMVRILLPYE